MAEKVEKQEDKYVLKEIPTNFEIAIGERDTDEAWTDKEVLRRILIKLDKIEKSIA